MGCFGSSTSSSPSPPPTKPTTPPNHDHRSSFSQRVQNDTCFRCRNRGHWATNCPLRTPAGSQSQNDTCFHCRNKGHWATDCPLRTPPRSQSQSDTCFHCRSKGHWATNCPLRAPPGSQSQNDTCFHCRNKGHWATDCPLRTPPRSQSQSDTCFHCSSKGHWATNCPFRTAPGSQSQNNTCFHCRNKGHWAIDCPFRSPPRSQSQSDTCFHCHNKGHWATNCPFRALSQSQSQSQSQPPHSQSKSPNSSIPCANGHGSYFLRISRSEANPERPCVVETDLGSDGGSNSDSNSKAKRDRAPDSFPGCRCGAGKCKLVQEKTGKYFVCPIQKGHGACSFKAAVDNTQPTKTATSGFNEGNEVSYQSPKRTMFDSPVMENPDQICTPVGPGPLMEEIVTENNDHNDILDMSTIQETAMEDGELEDFVTEKSIQVSRLTSNAIHYCQVEFLRQISASEDAIAADPIQQLLGALITGWLGRLAFPPSGCLTVALAKPFFCCVFPSFDPITVPKDMDTFNHGEINYQHRSHLNAQPDSSLQIPSQKQLLTILESTEPCNHKSMTEAANKMFSVLNQLSVDNRSFSERVRKYTSCASALAEIQDSMMADQSSEVIMEWYDNERAKFDKILRMQAETMDAVTASDKRLKSLGEETSRLTEMLLQIEDQLRRCEKENADLKTRLGKISEDMLEAAKKLNDAEAAKRLHEEKETERSTAKESLERARIQLRQSLFLV